GAVHEHESRSAQAGYASARYTRSGAKGSARRRLPVAFAMALAIAAEKKISESIRPRSRDGLPARRNQELGRVPSRAHRSYVNFGPPAYPSAGAIGASLVVKPAMQPNNPS